MSEKGIDDYRKENKKLKHQLKVLRSQEHNAKLELISAKKLVYEKIAEYYVEKIRLSKLPFPTLRKNE